MLTMASVRLLKATGRTNFTNSSAHFHFKLQSVNWQVRENQYDSTDLRIEMPGSCDANM